MRHRGRALAILLLALLLTGCPAGGDPVGSTAADPETSAAPSTSASAPPDSRPPAPTPPLTSLRATVPLPSEPGAGAVATAAVGTPDGGALVLLTPSDRSRPQSLVTVDARHAVGRSVRVPRLDPVWDMHLLPDGRVLVSGEFRTGERGYGFTIVDRATGPIRSSIVVPREEGTVIAKGRSAVSADGDTVYLFLSSFVEDRQPNLLVAADVATGRLLGGRDLFEDIRPLSVSPVSPYSVWLFARAAGGVDLLFDAFPRDTLPNSFPTLLRYDDALEPVGQPLFLTMGGSAESQAAAVAPDGTLFVSAEVQTGDWLLAVPPEGATASRVLELAGHTFDYALVVEPAQGWVLLPARQGARAVDLVTGGVTGIDVGCASSQPVRAIIPAATGSGALLLGQCDEPAPGTPMLWVTGP